MMKNHPRLIHLNGLQNCIHPLLLLWPGQYTLMLCLWSYPTRHFLLTMKVVQTLLLPLLLCIVFLLSVEFLQNEPARQRRHHLRA
jgi:hypothetical protein